MRTKQMASIRPRIYREFLRWYQKNRHRFDVPLVLLQRRDRNIKLVFSGVSSVIYASFGRCDDYANLLVMVEWDGKVWDLPLSLHTLVRRSDEGVICHYHKSDPMKIYPNRAALWREYLFEPFLEWVNASLAPDKWVGLYGEDRCFTWARLNDEVSRLKDEKHLVHILPVRHGTQ